MTEDWHIITCEYPPQKGGVSDYAYDVAAELAARGDGVHVWCPLATEPDHEQEKVNVHRTLGRFARVDLRNMDKHLNTFPAPRRLFVQWVPHGYGKRAMNIRFCTWLWRRAHSHKDQVELLVHEPFVAFAEGGWRQDGLALVHRFMIMVLLHAATRIWVTVPAWAEAMRSYRFGKNRPFLWLPVPSSVPVVEAPEEIAALRHRLAGNDRRRIIGHFGTCGQLITDILSPALTAVLRREPEAVILLMGRGTGEYRQWFVEQNPQWKHQVIAAGALPPRELSLHLGACDLMLQPYPDGVSARRTTVMSGLAHGKPVVTTAGRLTEEGWLNNDWIRTAPVDNLFVMADHVQELLHHPHERRRIGARARQIYDDQFSLARTVDRLRGESPVIELFAPPASHAPPVPDAGSAPEG